jgi:hypothetical protein
MAFKMGLADLTEKSLYKVPLTTLQIIKEIDKNAFKNNYDNLNLWNLKKVFKLYFLASDKG